MHEDGYTVVEDYLDAGQLTAFRDGMAPYLGTYRGRNPFEGRTTERVYTMVARGQVFEDITADPRLLAILDAFLKPSYLLSASHAIDIYPGEVAQSLHTDDSFYPIPRPRPAISISVIGAIDAFTAENGGTVILPRSHLWSTAELAAFRDGRVAGRPVPATQDAFSLEMPAGAIAVFPGTLVHGAGAAATPHAWPSPASIASPGRAPRRTSTCPSPRTACGGCRGRCSACWATTSCRRPSWARSPRRTR